MLWEPRPPPIFLAAASPWPVCAVVSMPFAARKLIVTYHPAYLLRDPRQKKEAWADLQIAMRELGLKLPAKQKGHSS